MAIVKNKTTQFLLPCLNFSSLVDLGNDNFINAYIAHTENDKYDNPVLFLAFNKPPTDSKVYDNCLEQYEIEDKYIIVHNIDNMFLDDYILFLHGRYSKFSITLKNKIKLFYGENSPPYGICIKRKKEKLWLEQQIFLDGSTLDDDAELSSIIDEENEILKTNLTLC